MQLVKRKPLSLKSRHLDEGLSIDEIKDYVSPYVQIVDMSNFKHFYKLKAGQHLTTIETYEYGESIVKECDKLNLPQSIKENIEKAAFGTMSSKVVSIPVNEVPVLDKPKDHFLKIASDLTSIRNAYNIDGYLVSLATPLEWAEKPEKALPQYILPFKVLLTHKPDCSNPTVMDGIPEDSSIRGQFAYPKLNELFVQIHEIGHLFHLSDAGSCLSKFYLELDADLFARDTFKTNGVNTDILRNVLNIRYYETLRYTNSHKHALSLDKLENNGELISYTDATTALDFITERICGRALYKVTNNLRYSIQGAPLKGEWALVSIDDKDMFSSLLKVYKAGEVKDVSYAEEYAEKILTAVDYIAPDFLRSKPNVKQAERAYNIA